jgi:glycosyltransferase 2 family protein
MKKIIARKYVGTLLRILIGIFILYFIFLSIDVKETLNLLKSTNILFFTIAFMLSYMNLLFMVLKLRVASQPFNENLPFKKTLITYYASDFAGSFFLEGIVNEAYKSKLYSSMKRGFFISQVDRLWSFLAYLIPASGAFLIFYIDNVILFFLWIILGIIAFISIGPSLLPIIQNFLFKIIREKGYDILNHQVLLKHIALSFAIVINTSIIFYLLFLSIESQVLFLSMLALIPVILIGISLPITVQGIGVREFILLYYANMTLISAESAIAVGALHLMIKLLFNLVGSIAFFIDKK